MIQTIQIAQNGLKVEHTDTIFIDGFSTTETMIYFQSLKEDLTEYPTQSIIDSIKKRINDGDYIFSDNFPEEPSDDHFIVLSNDGQISDLPQTNESIIEALNQLENNSIVDIARVRIESNLL